MQLEAHLIYVYKNHANNIGCRNEAGGGEGISYRRSEALKLKCFTYVVFQDVIIAPGMDAQGSRSDRATGLINNLTVSSQAGSECAINWAPRIASSVDEQCRIARLQ